MIEIAALFVIALIALAVAFWGPDPFDPEDQS